MCAILVDHPHPSGLDQTRGYFAVVVVVVVDVAVAVGVGDLARKNSPGRSARETGGNSRYHRGHRYRWPGQGGSR